MRKFGKVDGNQKAIVSALRQVGALVQSLASVGDGCPDLLVLFRGELHLLEIKVSKSEKLRVKQEVFHSLWGRSIHVVTDVDAALIAIGAVHSEKNWKPQHAR